MNKVPVVVALGSNLGDREASLRKGVLSLEAVLQVDRISRVVETPPWGESEEEPQGPYLNVVVVGQSDLAPEPLLDTLLEVERLHGRVRETRRNAPRVLDLDLIFHGETVRRSPRLTIPHPRWHLRAFVARPLLEVLPEGRDPESGLPLIERVAPGVFQQPYSDRGPLFGESPVSSFSKEGGA